MAIKLNDKVRIGKYDCEVSNISFGFYLNIDYCASDKVFTQFNLTYKDMSKLEGWVYTETGCIPFYKTLENLEKVIEFLQSHDKVIIPLYL